MAGYSRLKKYRYVVSTWALFTSAVLWGQEYRWANCVVNYHGTNWGHAIHRDNFGNLYSTGNFQDTIDVDPGPNTYILTSGRTSNLDGYLTKFRSDGSLVWAFSFRAASHYDQGFALASDMMELFTSPECSKILRTSIRGRQSTI